MGNLSNHGCDTQPERWVLKLKAACDAGYYKTETAEGGQISFPWQNKTCKDCQFWSNSVCHVYAEYRSPTAHTCVCFDPCNRKLTRSIIQEHRLSGVHDWRKWFARWGPIW
jgi:hypothetical protein